MTEIEIADQFRTSPDTLYEWARRHPEFAEGLRPVRPKPMRRSQRRYLSALAGARVPAVKIFTVGTRVSPLQSGLILFQGRGI